MKIVYLSAATIPSRSANSVQIMKMCGAFARAGHRVELIATARRDPTPTPDQPWNFYGVEPDFAIHRVRRFSLLPGRHTLYGWMSARKAQRLSPDLIYGRTLPGLHQLLGSGIPVVFESHSPEFARNRRTRHWAGALADSPGCLAIVTISEALRRAWLEAFPQAAGKLITVHDAADLPVSAKQPVQPETPSRRVRIGYLGSFHRGKGVELLVESARLCPDYAFHIAGGEPDQLAKWRSRADLPDNISFEGHIAHGGTPEWLAGMDILAAPYEREVSPRDGGAEIGRWMSPLKLFEYMAAGRAVVVSGLPVIREVVEHGQQALLAEPWDPQKWAEAFRTLAADPALRSELGSRGRASVERTHNWQRRAEVILSRVEPLLAGREQESRPAVHSNIRIDGSGSIVSGSDESVKPNRREER